MQVYLLLPLHLIDFDFTSTEYVSLEIMAFLTDCIIERNEPIDEEMGGSFCKTIEEAEARVIEYQNEME